MNNKKALLYSIAKNKQIIADFTIVSESTYDSSTGSTEVWTGYGVTDSSSHVVYLGSVSPDKVTVSGCTVSVYELLYKTVDSYYRTLWATVYCSKKLSHLKITNLSNNRVLIDKSISKSAYDDVYTASSNIAISTGTFKVRYEITLK